MSMIVLYSSSCVSCTLRPQLSKIKNFCWANKLKLVVKRTDHNAQNRQELEGKLGLIGDYQPNSYPPFVYRDKKAFKLKEISDAKLALLN